MKHRLPYAKDALTAEARGWLGPAPLYLAVAPPQLLLLKAAGQQAVEAGSTQRLAAAHGLALGPAVQPLPRRGDVHLLLHQDAA
jgi:hypothetical protein